MPTDIPAAVERIARNQPHLAASEIGSMLGVTRQYVDRILREAGFVRMYVPPESTSLATAQFASRAGHAKARARAVRTGR